MPRKSQRIDQIALAVIAEEHEACIVMTYTVMAYIVIMAYIGMVYIVMAYRVMAYIVMAYIVMALWPKNKRPAISTYLRKRPLA